MTVATILFLIPLAATAIILRLKRPAAVAVALLILMAGVLAGLSPCALHNYCVAGEPVLLSAHSGLNFYIGNNPTADGYPKMPPGMRASQAGMLQDSIIMAEKAAGRPLKRVEVSQWWKAKARDYIHEHPADWLRLMGVKLRSFWNAYQYDDLSMIPLLGMSGVLLPGPRFGLVAALAIAGMILAIPRFPKSRWVLAGVLLHMAALLPVFVTERYRLAAVPGLLVFAAFGVCELADKIAAFRWGAVAGQVALTCATALFVAWPYGEQSLRSPDAHNTGIHLTEAGKLDQAQECLERSFYYSPDNAETNFALGNLWLKRENRALAKCFYGRTLELNPAHAGALDNLAVVAIEEKRWESARRFLTASLAAEPNNPKGHYLLAKVLLQTGDRAAALKEAEAALAMRPAHPEFQQLRDDILKEAAAPHAPVSE
jgi:tetratricopeptide (TPR) repeat protein